MSRKYITQLLTGIMFETNFARNEFSSRFMDGVSEERAQF